MIFVPLLHYFKCKNTYSGHTIQAYINILPGYEKYKIRFFFF